MITNRTQHDVNTAKAILNKVKNGIALTPEEQLQYNAGLRGCYNVGDLNRVEAKVQELSELLNNNGYTQTVETKTDWEIGDILRYSDILRYLNNINTLRNVFYVSPTTPAVPTISQWIDYIVANNIEQILVDIEATIKTVQNDLLLCGSFYAGGDREHQHYT